MSEVSMKSQLIFYKNAVIGTIKVYNDIIVNITEIIIISAKGNY